MRRLSVILAACLCLVCGCSLGPVNTRSLDGDPRVRRADPNSISFLFARDDQPDPVTGQEHWTLTIQRKRPHLEGPSTFAVKCRRLAFDLSSNVFVRVRLGEDRRYWALLDTGNPGGLYLNDAVVRECGLAILPLGKTPETGCGKGVCEVPVLRIGPAAVTNPPCWYEQRQWQFRVLGQPLYGHRTVLVGLELMRLFSYVRFDNARRETVFGLHDAFEPDDPSEWVSVPFVLEQIAGGSRMMIDIFLGEHKARVLFDTGGAKPGLILRDSVWQNVGGPAGTAGRHASFQFGWLPCRRVVVPEVRLGPLILRDRRANVLAQSGPFLRDHDGILSLHYFRDTTVILDFRKNLIWIRKS